jgi:hypothetical protein
VRAPFRSANFINLLTLCAGKICKTTMQFVVPLVTEAIPAQDLQIESTRAGHERPRPLVPSRGTMDSVRRGVEGCLAGRVRSLPGSLGRRFGLVPVLRQAAGAASSNSYLLADAEEEALLVAGTSITPRQRAQRRARAAVLGKLAALRKEAFEAIVPATVAS